MVHIIFLFSVSVAWTATKVLNSQCVRDCRRRWEEVRSAQGSLSHIPIRQEHPERAIAVHVLFRCWRQRCPVLCGSIVFTESNPCRLRAVNTTPSSHGRGCRAAATPGRREFPPCPWAHSPALLSLHSPDTRATEPLTAAGTNIHPPAASTKLLSINRCVWSLQRLSALKIWPFLSKLGILQPWKLLNSTWNHSQTPQGLEWQTINGKSWQFLHLTGLHKTYKRN